MFDGGVSNSQCIWDACNSQCLMVAYVIANV